MDTSSIRVPDIITLPYRHWLLQQLHTLKPPNQCSGLNGQCNENKLKQRKWEKNGKFNRKCAATAFVDVVRRRRLGRCRLRHRSSRTHRKLRILLVPSSSTFSFSILFFSLSLPIRAFSSLCMRSVWVIENGRAINLNNDSSHFYIRFYTFCGCVWLIACARFPFSTIVDPQLFCKIVSHADAPKPLALNSPSPNITEYFLYFSQRKFYSFEQKMREKKSCGHFSRPISCFHDFSVCSV